eukprot:TRINITY_DN4022_c0_g2_i10.p8 TRINITY_DN4022_c0_g2~~TRINITY_DN4022_c0_g2_i10.p8  ORF type:complete len:143 (-),score=1.68 TRINITY_DN4022_c0_g2_i10:611-1039(-)
MNVRSTPKPLTLKTVIISQDFITMQLFPKATILKKTTSPNPPQKNTNQHKMKISIKNINHITQKILDKLKSKIQPNLQFTTVLSNFKTLKMSKHFMIKNYTKNSYTDSSALQIQQFARHSSSTEKLEYNFFMIKITIKIGWR